MSGLKVAVVVEEVNSVRIIWEKKREREDNPINMYVDETEEGALFLDGHFRFCGRWLAMTPFITWLPFLIGQA